MTFWTDQNLQPKRAFRFILNIPGNGSKGIQSFLAKSVTKPTFDLSSTPHQYLNHTFYYPGRVTWQPITIVVVDTVNDDMNATEAVTELLNDSGYFQPDRDTTVTISKKDAVNTALGNITIDVIDAQSNVVETWNLKNSFIQRAEFGNLDYASEEITNVTLTVQYDYAFIEVDGNILPA